MLKYILKALVFIIVFFPQKYIFSQNTLRSFDPSIDISQYVLDKWAIEDGLPHNTIDAIYQTHDGYIWIGTFGGLARFDGYQFTIFDNANTKGIKHNHISAFCEDTKGNLWIGTNGGGISLLSNGIFKSFSFADGLASDFIRCLAVDKDNNLWVGTEGSGINKIDYSNEQIKNWKITHFSTKNGLPNDIIRTMSVMKDGTIWIGTVGGICKWENGKFITYKKQQGLADNTIYSLCEDSSGALWIGTGNGLSRFQKNTFTNFTTKNGLSNNIVRSMITDSRKTLWIGTDGGGLNRFHIEKNNDQFSSYSVENGLSNNFVRTLCSDREGSIWIATRGGINRLSPGKFITLNMMNGLSDNFVRTILEDRDGYVWVGTNGGGLNIIKNGIIQSYTTKNGLSNNFVRSLYQDESGLIWVGTDGGGLNKLDLKAPIGKQFTQYLSPHSVDENFVRAISGDEKGLWIGTYGGGLVRFENGQFLKTSADRELTNKFIFSLHKDRNGNLWVGTNGGGVNVIRNGVVKAYTAKNGLSSDFIFCIYEDSDGNIWIGTNGGGLNKISVSDGKITQIQKRNGLYDDVILEIVEDDLGYFWMGTDRGIFRVKKLDLNNFSDGKLSTISYESYGRRDGMKSAECSGASQPSVCKMKDGKIFFPTLGGVVIIDPKNIQINQLPPPVIIEKFIADNVVLPINEKIEVTPGHQTFEIHYTGLSFIAPEKVYFQYRLEGFDKEWISVGNRRTAYYTNIPPGKYTFHVKARNNDGIWNEQGKSLHINLKPYFYQTIWFYFIVLLIITIGVFVVHRMRVRYLHHKAEVLVKIVDERTKELQKAKEKIEQVLKETSHARDLLAESNTALAIVNKDKTDLLNVVAHDLKNRLVSINSLARSILTNVTDQKIVKEKSDLIQISSDQTLELIKDLLDSAAIETGVMELKKKLVDMTHITEQVILQVKPQLDRKEQKLIINLLPKGDGIVEGDERWLKEAIYNLINNAHKFSPRGTTISVSVYTLNNEVRFDVKDEGPGLTESDKQKLFERFQRLSARPTEGESTSGLGLAIVKKCIELHAGNVWAEGALGKGSTFSFTLPLRKEK